MHSCTAHHPFLAFLAKIRFSFATRVHINFKCCLRQFIVVIIASWCPLIVIIVVRLIWGRFVFLSRHIDYRELFAGINNVLVWKMSALLQLKGNKDVKCKIAFNCLVFVLEVAERDENPTFTHFFSSANTVVKTWSMKASWEIYG